MVGTSLTSSSPVPIEMSGVTFGLRRTPCTEMFRWLVLGHRKAMISGKAYAWLQEAFDYQLSTRSAAHRCWIFTLCWIWLIWGVPVQGRWKLLGLDVHVECTWVARALTLLPCWLSILEHCMIEWAAGNGLSGRVCWLLLMLDACMRWL